MTLYSANFFSSNQLSNSNINHHLPTFYTSTSSHEGVNSHSAVQKVVEATPRLLHLMAFKHHNLSGRQKPNYQGYKYRKYIV